MRRFSADDSEEFEIVQFGAQLTDEQLVEAERLASTLVSRHAIAENGAIGPTGIADAIKELRSRRARYKLNGKLAALELPDIPSPLLKGMQLFGHGRVIAQLVKERQQRSNAPRVALHRNKDEGCRVRT